MEFNINNKIFTDFNSFNEVLKIWKRDNEKVVFTNGCFDIIHHGHVDSLIKCAKLGTKLIVGLNSDVSVKILKGEGRPIIDEMGRAQVLAAFEFVDAVIIFNEETPAEIIAKIIPDVLVKGKQYEIHEIAGHDTVLENGGEVVTLELVPGISTSDIIQKIKTLH
jgi:D-beta-D-heptose 7-phosphate kinase/D-beta-D-heptose 1-phosphate adenosyltransferase